MKQPSLSLIDEYKDLSFPQLFQVIAKSEHTSVTNMNLLASFAVEKARDIQHPLFEVQSLFFLGKSLLRLGKLVESQQILLEAQTKGQHLNFPSIHIEILMGLGTIQYYLHIYDQAYSFYMQALELAIEQMDHYAQSRIYNNLGEIYREHKEYDRAVEHYQKSIDLLADNQPRSTQYSNFCAVAIEKGEYDQAEIYAFTALDLAKSEGNRMIESVLLKNLGSIYRFKKDFAKSVQYYHESLSLYQLTNELIHMSEVYIELHFVSIDTEEYDKAKVFLQQALDYAMKVDSDMLLSKIYGHFARVYVLTKDYELGYHYKELEKQKLNHINEIERNLRLRSILTMEKMMMTHKENVELTVLTQQYREKSQLLEETLYSLQRLSDVGKMITSVLDLEQVYEIIFNQVKDLIPNDFFGIGLVDEADRMIEYKFMVEDGTRVYGAKISIDSPTSFAAYSYKKQEEILVNSKDDTYKNYVQIRTSTYGEPMNALMFVPLILQGKAIGVLSAQTRLEGVYNAQTLSTLKTLASYLSIAILNAQKSDSLRREVEQRKAAQQKLEQMNASLDKLSKIDALTGLANRRYFDDVAQMIVHNAQRLGLTLSMLMIDVDHFKEFNDEFGHLYGDAMIKLVARIIEDAVQRSSDVVARFGGDEFIVLLSDTDVSGAELIARKMVEKLEETTQKYKQEVTLSIGIASLSVKPGIEIEDIIDLSDKALYQAKQNGRNQIVINNEKETA